MEPRPRLGRARTSPTLSRVSTADSFGCGSSGTSTPRTDPLRRKLSIAEKIAFIEATPIDRGPWHPDSAYYVPRRSSRELREILLEQDVEYRRQKELKRLSRQADRSRSRSNSQTGGAYSPNLSRNNSLRSFNSAHLFNTSSRVSSLKHSETASTASSVPSSVSTRSPRLHKVQSTSQDDRVPQKHDTQEQQLRKPKDGTKHQQVSPSNGGSGQRGLFGRHKSKNPRFVFLAEPQVSSTNVIQRTLERSTARIDVST